MKPALLGLLTLLSLSPALTGVEVHYAPAERLDAIDAELIGEATSSIDLAAYVLTDWRVINALKIAKERGVAIRIVVDGRERLDSDRLGPLLSDIRTRQNGPLMHLKAYSVDGTVLRTGSANFSYSGETAQNNELVIIRDPKVARQFDIQFEKIWDETK